MNPRCAGRAVNIPAIGGQFTDRCRSLDTKNLNHLLSIFWSDCRATSRQGPVAYRKGAGSKTRRMPAVAALRLERVDRLREGLWRAQGSRSGQEQAPREHNEDDSREEL